MVSRYYLSNFLTSLSIGIFLLFSIFFSYIYFGFNLIENSIIIFVCILLYFFVLSILIVTSRDSSINTKEKKIQGRPIKRSENDIINAIVNEVYNNEDEMVSTYVGDSKNRTYHLSECRLAFKVPAKFRLENNSLEFFKKRKFKKCKTCLKN